MTRSPRNPVSSPYQDPGSGARARRDAVAAIALLDEPNRRRLYELVAAHHDDVGRDEAAAMTGISRELAAFHLDRLVEGGLLESGYRRLGGRRGPGAGRPAKVYRRADRDIAVSLPVRRYSAAADVFAAGLERLRDRLGTGVVIDAVAEVARERGRNVGAQARRAAGPRTSWRGLRATLVSLLRGAGYEPVVDQASGGVTLGNCPYRIVAETHRDLTCGANLAWAEGVVDGLGDSRLTPELAPAPGRCCVVFSADA